MVKNEQQTSKISRKSHFAFEGIKKQQVEKGKQAGSRRKMGEQISSETLQSVLNTMARHLLKYTNLDMKKVTASSSPVPTSCPPETEGESTLQGLWILLDAVSQGLHLLIAQHKFTSQFPRTDLLRILNPSLLGPWMPHSGLAD